MERPPAAFRGLHGGDELFHERHGMNHELETDATDTQIEGNDFTHDAPAADDAGDGAKVNKSAEVRAEASRLIEAGRHPRPVEIVRALEERGITVAPAQVSIVLKKMGLQGRTRQSKKSASAKPPVRPALPPVPEKPLAAPPVVANRPQRSSSADAAYTVDQLLAAKTFVEEVGSPQQAMQLLEALGRLLK